MINSIVFLLVYLLAIPMGIFSATAPHSTGDRIMTLTLFVLYSLRPSGWQMLRRVCSNRIWASRSDCRAPMRSTQSAPWLWGLHPPSGAPHTLYDYASLAYISRQMRAGMLEVVRQDYIPHSQSQRLQPRASIWVHALRNSFFPIITLFASLLPALIAAVSSSNTFSTFPEWVNSPSTVCFRVSTT